MRKLDRAVAPSPPCLAVMRHGTHRWDEWTGDQRREIGAPLEQFQNRLSARAIAPISRLLATR